MFRLLAFLTIAIFAFNMLPSSYAQELSVQAQAEADAKKDLGPIFKSDFFSMSLTVGCLGCLVGSCTGLLIGGTIDDSSGSFFGYGPNDTEGTGCCVGAILLGVVPALLYINLNPYKPNPPSERLLGKPPEYIVAYTRSYQSATAKLSKEYVTIGTLVGNLAAIGGAILLAAGLVN